MKVLIAIKGLERDGFIRRALGLAPIRDADLVLVVHVIDSIPRHDLEAARERFLGRRALGPERVEELARVEEDRARGGIAMARRVLVEGGVHDERVRDITLRGRPKDELCSIAKAEAIDLIVVAGRAGKPGPHSVGKTARFVIDHAPVGALLIRPECAS